MRVLAPHRPRWGALADAGTHMVEVLDQLELTGLVTTMPSLSAAGAVVNPRPEMTAAPPRQPPGPGEASPRSLPVSNLDGRAEEAARDREVRDCAHRSQAPGHERDHGTPRWAAAGYQISPSCRARRTASRP